MTEYFISQYKDDSQKPLYCCGIGDLSDEKGDYERSEVECFEFEYFLQQPVSAPVLFVSDHFIESGSDIVLVLGTACFIPTFHSLLG